MRSEILILYIIVFLYGIVLGSFLNVLIYRLPLNESIAKERSHCTRCGKKIKWYDLIPLLSYIILRGKCRYCNEKVSLQYPIVELINGLGYTLIIYIKGFSIVSILMCLIFSLLIAISVIDWRTMEIPFGLNISIFVLAVIRIIFDYENLLNHLIGFVVISGFMLICLIIARVVKGIDAFGGGDIKLMAAAGLFVGAKEVILAFFVGCILGAVIHTLRMKISGAESVLAFGPYLCAGLLISMLYGEEIINWYLNIIL